MDCSCLFEIGLLGGYLSYDKYRMVPPFLMNKSMKGNVIIILLIFVLIGISNDIHAQAYKRQSGDEDRVVRCEKVKMLCTRTRQKDKEVEDNQKYEIIIDYNQGRANWLYCDIVDDFTGRPFGSPGKYVRPTDLSKKTGNNCIYVFSGYNNSDGEHWFGYYTAEVLSGLSTNRIVFGIDENEYLVFECNFGSTGFSVS
mgnify:CR=1 FL=1